MEGDRGAGCLSAFTALWTCARNGYHMAGQGERKEEPCMNLAEFMEVKEEVKKRKRPESVLCEGGFGDLLCWDVGIQIFF